jgi:hypothetical protein
MKRTVVSLTMLLMSSFGARGAWGQAEEASFGRTHQLVFSADRLFGYMHSSATESYNGAEETGSSSNVSIFSSPLVANAAAYASPRLAFDGFVTDGLSLGGSVSYFWTSAKDIGATSSHSIDGFMIMPRVGYALALGQTAAIWPRVGFSYVHASGSGTTVNLYALTIEAPLVIVLGPHVALLAGPTLDLGVGGSADITGSSIKPDYKETDIGVQFGIAGTL